MDFCFAKWFKVLKRHGLKKEGSNEELMRQLFFIVRRETGTKTKGDEDWVAKETVSAIINRKESLPKGIKRALTVYDFDKLCAALSPFYSSHLLKDELVAAANEALAVYASTGQCDREAEDRLKSVKNDPKKILTFLLIESAKVENKLYGIKRNVYACGSNAINYIFGDIIAMSLSAKQSKKRAIYVIPVDADFHFHVTYSGETPACVSPNTVHGKWIKRLEALGMSEGKITEIVGHTQDGKIGDIRTFEFNGSLFYLLACSKFNEQNVAHSSRAEIKFALEKLLEYHDSFGQGDELYVPLIGTGSSRAKLALKESFELIKETILENQQWHNGHITIVLHISAIEKMEEMENVLQN